MTTSQSATVFLVALARMLPIAWLAPPLGGASRVVRLGLGLGLGIMAYFWVGQPPTVPLGLVLIHEVMIGVSLGLVTALPFYAAKAAGALIDYGRHPQRDDHVASRAYFWLSLAVFAALGGLTLWLKVLGESYVLIPIGHSIGSHGVELAIQLGTRLLGLGLTLAAPVLAAMLAVDLVLALVARAAPTLRGVGQKLLREPFLLATIAAVAGLTTFWLRGDFANMGNEMRNAMRLLSN